MSRSYLLGLSVLALAACSGVIGCDAFKPTRYIHAVEVALAPEDYRQESPGTLLMGTPCKVLKEEGLRVLVRCSELKGYVETRDLGPGKPTVEAFLKAATDPQEHVSDRVRHATRAVALAPANAEARATLKKAYLDDQFSTLQFHKEEDFPANERESVCGDSQTVEECLTVELLSEQLFSTSMVERRGADFVAVGFQAGQLYSASGTLKRSPSAASRDISYTVYSREFGGIVDVPRVAEVLGLKPAKEPTVQPRYTTNGSYYSDELRDQLHVEDGATSTELVNLRKRIPSGRSAGELREDLHLMMRLDLLLVGDFDQDGRDDALVQIDTGGNCCEPCYFFATVPRKGKPVLTNSFCSWWGPPLVEWMASGGGRAHFSLPERNGAEKTFILSGSKARRAP